MELPVGVKNAEIEKALAKYREPLLVSAYCFDMFRDASGKKLAADRKSIAWSFSYRAEDRTLKSEEVDAARRKASQPTLREIATAAARFFSLKLSDLRSPSRRRILFRRERLLI